MTNTTEKKMTQREYFAVIKDMLLGNEVQREVDLDEIIEFVDGRIAQLEKKSASRTSAEHKPTAKQIANEAIKSAILENMAVDTLYSITDMVKNFDCFDESTTSQKVNALIKQMIEVGAVERIEDKRKAYFRKVVA